MRQMGEICPRRADAPRRRQRFIQAHMCGMRAESQCVQHTHFHPAHLLQREIWHFLAIVEICQALDAACVAIGRDPATLRRSYTMFDTQARHRGGAIGYYESTERFIDQASRVAELGISDIGLYYPLDPVQRSMFETISSEVLPSLRASYPSIG